MNLSEVEFRQPSIEDAEICMEYINSLIDENLYIAHLEKFTLEEEQKFLSYVQELCETDRGVTLAALHDGKIIGICGINRDFMKKSAMDHVAIMDISVSVNWRGSGLAKLLFEKTLDTAKSLDLELIELYCDSNNEGALRFYEKLGFSRVGSRKRHSKRDGKYSDIIIMEMWLPKS
ncbi:TPA: GNAT family N-acetyltransferase [archaeon]|uniref:Histone acetyltransferase HPA2 family protein n=1 Tax=uncultured marine group II/III euryarchaeote KM3_51_D01 TaxID=1456454 RepID=A0A075H9U1_9EURY|nr:histone acetyltransferase HPA2 family protein [uncultured marine group II/III euryarchaeote KM3_51_D01]HIK02189.1 GNAT family N-acetyltransferase [Candidatus Undinarchaeales archaeon SRR5007147.bin71]